MNDTSRLHGFWSASLTPLGPDLSIDVPALIEHSRWHLARGCHGIALFGTTGEGTSFSVGERKTALEAVIAAGVPAASIMAGRGRAPLTPRTQLTAHPGEAGCGRGPTPPPPLFPN